MSKRVVATIMDRINLVEDAYVFRFSHLAIGKYDEESQTFIDEKGNKYYSLLNEELLNSQVPHAFSTVCDIEKIPTSCLKEVLKDYEKKSKSIISFVIKTDNVPIIGSFDVNELKQISNEEYNDEEYEDDMDPELKELIMDVVNGKYSLNELKEIQDELQLNIDDLDAALETVKIQIEASEKGVSFVELAKDENEEELKDLINKIINKEEKEEQEEHEEVFEKIDIDDLYNKVTKTLIAQDEPARRVIVEIARKEMDIRKKKEGILLTGSTGVGKTELMRLIAKNINRPFYKIDTSQLTVPGYVGKDIEQELWNLYLKCGKDLKKVERAILFLDEIDKKGSERKNDVHGQGVLNLMLSLIEGTTYDACADMKTSVNKVKIDTSNMIIIFGGAFTDVYKNLIEKNGVGFGNRVSNEPSYRKATTKDFIEKGMMTDEFMGRVTVIKLNDLDVEAIKRVMLESDESAIKIQQEIFEKLGVKLTFTDGYTKAIAENAYKNKTGARGLNGVIDETTWRAFDQVYSHDDIYEEVILDEETVKDPTIYQLVKKIK